MTADGGFVQPNKKTGGLEPTSAVFFVGKNLTVAGRRKGRKMQIIILAELKQRVPEAKKMFRVPTPKAFKESKDEIAVHKVFGEEWEV